MDVCIFSAEGTMKTPTTQVNQVSKLLLYIRCCLRSQCFIILFTLLHLYNQAFLINSRKSKFQAVFVGLPNNERAWECIIENGFGAPLWKN